MSSWALGDDGDLVVQNGSLLRVSGRDAIAQDIVCRLRFVRGEWYQNQNDGTPWFEDIFGDGFSEPVARAILSRVVRETPGVVSLDTLTLDQDASTRTLTADIAATTQDGDTLVLQHIELNL